MLGVLLGLASGLCWGTADFYGGLESRRSTALAVVLWSQATAAVALMVVMVAAGASAPAASLAWGAAAGVLSGTALWSFYRGLALGTMSVVAPVSACGAAVPVVVALARGEVPGAGALAGIALAIAGIVAVSLPGGRRPGAPRERRSLALALVAAAGFGGFFVLVDQGTSLDGASPLAVIGAARLGSLAALGAVVVFGRAAAPFPVRRWPMVAAIGLVDTTANVLFAYAATRGNLGVVGVLASLYPVVTVVLARLLLAERLSRTQTAGVATSLVGVSLIALG